MPPNPLLSTSCFMFVVHVSDAVSFTLSGTLDRAVCDIEQPLQGNISVEHSAKPIKSIELQLVRVETCGCAEGYVLWSL